jgi:hypothetical protein
MKTKNARLEQQKKEAGRGRRSAVSRESAEEEATCSSCEFRLSVEHWTRLWDEGRRGLSPVRPVATGKPPSSWPMYKWTTRLYCRKTGLLGLPNGPLRMIQVVVGTDVFPQLRKEVWAA